MPKLIQIGTIINWLKNYWALKGSYFHKLAINLLGDAINEMVESIRVRSDFLFYNQALSSTRLGALNSLSEQIIRYFPMIGDSDDTIFSFLSNLILEVQSANNNERYQKLMDLLYFLKQQCVATDTWNIAYDDSDPLSIFQYHMISFIASKVEGSIVTQRIKQEISYVKERYLCIVSDSAKLSFIQSYLLQMKNSTISLSMSRMGSYSLPRRPSRVSSLQRVIESAEIQLQELMLHPDVLAIKLPANSLFSLSIVKSNEDRFDELQSNEKLERLGYKQAEINPDWLCSIYKTVVDDPVSSGSSYKGLYERKALINWLAQNSKDPVTREVITTAQVMPLPHVKKEINKFLTEQEAIKKYFVHCLEHGLTSQEESMALVPYRASSCVKL